MYSKIFLNILSILFLSFLELSFVSALPSVFSDLNLALLALVMVLLLWDFNIALWWALAFGVIFDIYSFLPFGIFSVSFFVSIVITNFFLRNFFTNRSPYSFLALVFLEIVFFELFLNLGTLVFNNIFLGGYGLEGGFVFWKDKLYLLAVNLPAALIIFYLVNFITRRLKPVFIMKG